MRIPTTMIPIKKHVEIENALAQDGTVADTFEL